MSLMQPLVFKGSKEYQIFVATYKGKIRPVGQLKRMNAALGIDAEFKSRFDIFRTILKKSQLDWGREIILRLYALNAFRTELDDDDFQCIAELYARHVRLFRIGEFDEVYLNSIEDIALFFLHHDVKSIFLAGAYRELTDIHIDLVVEEVSKQLVLPLAHSLKALTMALTTELNQIQRVYTMYERHVSDSLIKDLSYGGILTGMPTGRKKSNDTPKE